MEIMDVDDCIKSIKLEDNTILYNRTHPDCKHDKNANNKEEYHFEEIPYEIDQKLNIDVYDIGGSCFLKAKATINNLDIYTNDKNFWKCSDCENLEYYNDGEQKLECYIEWRPVDSSHLNKFNFYFQIDSILKLKSELSEYYYYLIEINYFFISPQNLNEKINLIDLHLMQNLYAKNKDEIKKPFYDYICYKIFFYKYFFYKGKFIGSDESNNDLSLNEETYSKIFEDKPLRYELSEDEKKNNGTHIRIRIGIFNNEGKAVSSSQEFNFFICLDGYQFCDLETSMKCLKEGYYQENNRNYSCYETCKNCDSNKKPDNANYFKNYCDECKDEYSYFVNVIEDENEENKIEYKSCYKECPPHAPILKEYGKKECVSYCPRYKTSERRCVDSCDYEHYKYLLKNESICYNYIPKNYFIYIDNYTENYNNTDKPIIKLGKECPNDTYDSSFNNFCINLDEDIFHFVKNPNELITYNNPLIKKLKTKEMVIRAYSSEKQLENINNNKDKLIQIDISKCEQKIKSNYGFSNDKVLIFHDVFNLETEKYFFRVFTQIGEELDYTICNKEDIIIKEIKYNIQRPENVTKCPKDFPYLQIDTNQCLKNCEITNFINKNCKTDDLNEDNQMNNINNLRKAIEDHSIDYLLDNITKGGNDITIEEKNIKYQLSSSWNQNNRDDENISNIRLGQCENILKEK